MIEGLIISYFVLAAMFFMVAVADKQVELNRKTVLQFGLISLVWPVALGVYVVSR